MLSNLETEKSKLVQIVLVGQPNLRDFSLAVPRTAPPARHGPISPGSARLRGDLGIHRFPAATGCDRRTAAFSHRCRRPGAHAQRGRTSDHQHHLRLYARLRLRGGQAPHRSRTDRGDRCGARSEWHSPSRRQRRDSPAADANAAGQAGRAGRAGREADSRAPDSYGSRIARRRPPRKPPLRQRVSRSVRSGSRNVRANWLNSTRGWPTSIGRCGACAPKRLRRCPRLRRSAVQDGTRASTSSSRTSDVVSRRNCPS